MTLPRSRPRGRRPCEETGEIVRACGQLRHERAQNVCREGAVYTSRNCPCADYGIVYGNVMLYCAMTSGQTRPAVGITVFDGSHRCGLIACVSSRDSAWPSKNNALRR